MIIKFSDHQAPVEYSIDITHSAAGKIEATYHGISDSDLSKERLAVVLRSLADDLEKLK